MLGIEILIQKLLFQVKIYFLMKFLCCRQVFRPKYGLRLQNEWCCTFFISIRDFFTLGIVNWKYCGTVMLACAASKLNPDRASGCFYQLHIMATWYLGVLDWSWYTNFIYFLKDPRWFTIKFLVRHPCSDWWYLDSCKPDWYSGCC